MKRNELYITIEPDDIKRTAFTLVNSSDLKNYKDDHYAWSMKVSGSVEHINMLGDGGVICYGGNIGSIDVRNGRLNISHNATVSNIRELGGCVSYDDISTIHFMTSVLQGSIVTTPFTIHHVTTFKDCEILNEGTVYEYGVLKDSHIGKNGYVLAKAHSIIDSVVVSDGGHLFAEDRAHLKNIYIAKGGSISICPRTHTHHVTACTGSTVYVNPKVKEESLKLIKMEEGVTVKTTDNKTDGDSDSFAFLAKADDLNDQSDVYLTLYTTTDTVEDFEFEYLLVHILNHNYKLYCKMDWWNGDSKPCKLENPYKFMNPLDPRDKATFEYRGLLHLKDCYLVDAETDMSVGDLDFLAKADILGMTYRSTKDFRCLIDKKGALFRQKNLYVCDEPLCYECLGDPECKPVDDTRYDWQKEAKELSVQYPGNLVIGGYSANNVCTLREIYLEYNRFGYDKPITCHIGFKNATVNFNPETNYMTVRLIDWGLWFPEDQSVFEHDCILDSIKITGWGYDHDTKGFYVPHFTEAWYNGRKVDMAEKTENSRIVNFLDYGVMISTTKPMLNALKNIPSETKDVLTKSLDVMVDDVENVISSNLVIHCRTNYQDSYISWIEIEFPGVDKTEKSIYIAFWNKPEISYNPVTNIYSFIFKDQDWSLRQIDDENKVSDLNKSWIKDAKITHISFHEELPKNFQFDLIDVKYDGEKIAGPPFVKFGIWGTLDNPNTTESKGSIGLYDPNEDTKLHPEKKNNGFFTIGPNTQHYWNTPVCTFKPDGDIHLNSTLMDMSKKVEVTSIVINPGDDKFDFCDEATAYGPTISCKPTESKGSIELHDPNYVKYGVRSIEENPNTSRKKKEEVTKNLKDAVEKTTQKNIEKDPPKPVKHVLVLTGTADKGYKEWTEEKESPDAPWCTVRCNLTGIFANIFGGDYRIAYERSCVRYSPDTHFNAIILEGLHLYHLGTGKEQSLDIMRHCDYIYGVEFRDNKSPQYVINSVEWNGIAIRVRPNLAQFHEPFRGKQLNKAGVIYVDLPDRMKEIDPTLIIKGKSNYDFPWFLKLKWKSKDGKEFTINSANRHREYNKETHEVTYKLDDWYAEEVSTHNYSYDEILDGKITDIWVQEDVPEDFALDIDSIWYKNKRVPGPPYLTYHVAGEKKCVNVFDPNKERKKGEKTKTCMKEYKDPDWKKFASRTLEIKCDVAVHVDGPYEHVQVRKITVSELDPNKEFESKDPYAKVKPVNFCSTLEVKGSTTSDISILKGGHVKVTNKGYIDNARVYPGGILHITQNTPYGHVFEFGGFIDFDGDETNTVNRSTTKNLKLDKNLSSCHKGTTYLGVTMENGSKLHIRGKVAHLTTKNEKILPDSIDWNEVNVYNDGRLSNFSINAGGELNIFKGAHVKHGVIYEHGSLTVYDIEHVENILVRKGATIQIDRSVFPELKDKTKIWKKIKVEDPENSIIWFDSNEIFK